jgi:hypothetical protein
VAWLWTLLALPGFAAAYAAGFRLARRAGRVPAVVAGVGTSFIVLRAVLRWLPDLDYALLPFDLYAALRPWWAFPFIFVVLGVGTPRMSTPFARRGLAVFAGILYLYAASRLVATAVIDLAEFRGVPGVEGNCGQTTDYSCGAAAAATMLARLGVPSDEREMVLLCGTTALTGTDEFGVCRGLRNKLVGTGSRVGIVRTDWEGLRRRPLPAMAVVAHSFLVDHWVVVLEAGEGEALVGDPLFARPYRQKKEEFLRRWRGVLVEVVRGSPFPVPGS